jgi:hypothetical protein
MFDEILATFRVMVERDGIEVFKPEAMREVRQAAAIITLNPHLARAFRGGITEVSVFWVDGRGIPCKCRLDWLKPRTIVDIKKCANVRERPFGLAVLLAIAEYRYDISARHYLDGFQYLYRFAEEGRVFGNAYPFADGTKRGLAATARKTPRCGATAQAAVHMPLHHYCKPKSVWGLRGLRSR